MKYKIGVYGSAVDDIQETTQKATELGNELGKNDVILITGAGHGIPYLVATTAVKSNPKIEIWGFPPTTTQEGLVEYMPQVDLSIYKKLFYVPSDFQFVSNIGACRQYRNLMSTATADAGVVISGRWGSMSEFSSLREMGKVIGVLTGSGGLADELEELSRKLNKESKGKVIFDSSPENLIRQMLAELDNIKA